MKEKKSGFWETFILFAIILVIFQTFFEELAVLDGWSVRARHILTFSGLFFDLLFTIEFIIRQIRAAIKRQGLRYFLRERGWIDLLSSVPLLLLNSLPHTLSIILASDGGYGALPGFANLMKVVKAVRITRVLRFIRMIKLFGKIHNAESVMAQRHISRIASLMVLGLIAVMMGGAIAGLGPDEDATVLARKAELQRGTLLFWRASLEGRGAGFLHARLGDAAKRAIMPLVMTNTKGEAIAFRSGLSDLEIATAAGALSSDAEARKIMDPLLVKAYFSGNPRCLSIEMDGGMRLYQKIKYDSFRHFFDRDDFFIHNELGFRFTVSLMDLRRDESSRNMISLVMILVVVLLLIVFYTKHFAQTVSDVIHVMRRGMSEPDYNLQVRINPAYSDDEVYRLAELYNEEWLSLKDMHRPLDGSKQEEKGPGLSLDDFFGTK